MEQAKITVEKSKKGKLIANIIFSNGKKMSLPPKFKISESINGKKCMVKREKGQIVKILIDGKELEMNDKKILTNKNTHYNSHNSEIISFAIAPYNFIPLNKKIVSVDKPKDFNTYYGNTGYIDIEIEAQTPVFIRGKEAEFYKQAGKYRIPGSSLRGMIRTLVEIVSWSEFNFSLLKNSNIKFFYRTFTDKSKDLENEYREDIVGGNMNVGFFNKVNAGYIKKVGLNKYIIIPAKKINCTQFYRVEDEMVVKAGLNEPISIPYEKYNKKIGKKEIKYKLNPKYEEKIEKILFIPENVGKHPHSVPLQYAKVKSIRKYSKQRNSNEVEGYLLCTGYVPSKRKGKHLHWIIGPQDNGISFDVPIDVINNFNMIFDYKKRISGKKGDNPIKKLEINGDAIPCFYVLDNNKIKAFGFTGFFSLPYKNELRKFLPKEHLNNDYDIAKSIFGIEDKFMTRVFFEDAFLLDEYKNKVEKKEKFPKILAEPKPTAFQLYLEQDINSITPVYNRHGQLSGWNNINSYNSNTIGRGNKLYWHKDDSTWYENEENVEKHKTQYTKIKPINPGAKFKGRIRFENLTDVELGALLFVLDLPDGFFHKIGMGKPHGLGSVKISPKLFLSNRKDRYKNLFAELGELKAQSKEKINEFKKRFEEFILNEIEENNKKSLWDTDRLKELAAMLDFRKKPSSDKTQYMDLTRFKKREILPKPTEII